MGGVAHAVEHHGDAGSTPASRPWGCSSVLVERLFRNQEAEGSSPFTSTPTGKERRVYEPSENQPGTMDDLDVVYAMAREGHVPHLYRGLIPPGGFIHRLAVCQRVIVDRVAVPADTAGGRICRWCERAS